MNRNVVLISLVVVAVLAFLIGRFTATDSRPSEAAGEQAPSAQVAAPAAAPATPPAPAAAQPPAPPPKPRPLPPPPRVVVPPGTKAATDPSPAKGPADAKVIFLEVSDFQCPVCKRSYEPLRGLADEFPGQVRLVFKHNALAMHRDAMNAAAASMAAHRQKKFDAMADVLFENQRSLSEDDLFRHAQQAGLNMDKFKKDYEDPTLRARIQAEGDMATELGAAGTPAFFVNGYKQVGWASYEAAKQMASREIAAVDALMAQGKSLKEARLERLKVNLPEYEKFLGSWLGLEHR